MTHTTPTHEFLCEIADINAFITDALACPKKSSWHWPSFYLMYVEVDRLLGLITRIQYLFDSPFAGLAEPPTTEEWAQEANDLFAKLTKQQKAVVQWLWQISRYTTISAENPTLHQRLNAHVHPKSGWFQIFMQEYCSGRLDSDGTTLRCRLLPTDRTPSGERISDMTASCMLREQVFDLETSEVKLALAHAAQHAGQQLGTVAMAMHHHLIENCTIHDLMHPSSL